MPDSVPIYINNTWCVYMHINKINGKKYIGITSQKPFDRWGNGSGYSSQVFYSAIQKYGWDNFDHVIIADNLLKEEACTLERKLIREQKTLCTQHGYNVTHGGDGRSGGRILQFSMYGDFMCVYENISAAAESIGLPISNLSVCCSQKVNHAGGYVWRYEEDVKNPYEYYKEFDFSVLNSIYPIYQFTLDQHYIRAYNCAAEAHDYTNKIFSSSILDCCRGKFKNACGYIWRFQKDVPDPYQFFKEKIVNKKKEYIHTVCQFDLSGKYLRSFNSPSEAAKKYGCDTHTITYACSGRTKSGAGFLWRYHEHWDGTDIEPYDPGNIHRKIKGVAQYDKDGVLVAEYASTREASEQTGIKRNCIKDVLRNKNEYTHGYHFVYTGKTSEAPMPNTNLSNRVYKTSFKNKDK